ncbi:MAG: PLP-dependent aspartate aminotransferase family protein [Microbacterium sp.]|uniref:trans-sulfuration enzyme family protein n=1 Tax=Microbacterium sp. TaxID=51671 RepID=UPI0039E6AD02
MPDHLLHPDTVAVHSGREDLAALGAHAVPIDLSSTYPLPDIEHGGDAYEAMTGGGYPPADGGMVYARLWNPTVARFERALAELEHAPAAVAFSSGMAAMTAVLLAHTATTGRAHVVAVRPLYGGTDHLLDSGLLGIEATFCAEHEVAASIRPDTALVILESPGNPTLELADIAADIAAVVAQAGEVPVLVDNTFATPVLQNPLDLGARMSLHSATKYLGGHGDVVAGVVACDEATAEMLRPVRAITGAILHPLGAYLLHRGLATLPTRVRAQQANAERIAAWLSTHPAVEKVHYPGIDDDRGLIGRQQRGAGAMVSISLRGGFAAASAVASSVEVFTHAVSLGGVDSLIQHPAALTHRPVAPEARPSAGVLRLSIGLEDADDLIADLDAALAAATRVAEAEHATF